MVKIHLLLLLLRLQSLDISRTVPFLTKDKLYPVIGDPPSFGAAQSILIEQGEAIEIEGASIDSGVSKRATWVMPVSSPYPQAL
jgi:hypothetical protein